MVKLNFLHHYSNSSLQCHVVLQKSFCTSIFAYLVLKKHFLLSCCLIFMWELAYESINLLKTNRIDPNILNVSVYEHYKLYLKPGKKNKHS